MKQCNNCDSTRCDIMRDFRKKRIDLSPEEMSLDCKRHRKPPTLTNSVFVLGMVSNPQGLYDVLDALKLSIVETYKKPYFAIK